MVEGQPIETRPPEKADDKPLFPEQTRAPYHKAHGYKVTTITDKLHLPWSTRLPAGRQNAGDGEISRASSYRQCRWHDVRAA